MVRLAEAALKRIVLAVNKLILGNAEVKPNFDSEIEILIEQSKHTFKPAHLCYDVC